MKISAGKLDRRLVIAAPTVTRDEMGQDIPTYADIVTIYGQVLALRIGQQPDLHPNGPDKAPGQATVSTARYLIRYRTDLALGHRVTTELGSQYYITAIEEPDRRTTMIVTVAA